MTEELDGGRGPETGRGADRLQRVLAQVPALAGQRREVQPLGGGTSNTVVRVRTAERTLVVRLFGTDDDLVPVDREAEHLNSLRAAESGVAPDVVSYLPDDRALVVEWVGGNALTSDDLADETTLTRAADLCRLLHAGPRFVGDLDIASVQHRYLRTVQERGFRLPPGYLELLPRLDRIRAALGVGAGPTLPCHNDLVAANFVDTGDRLWLVDFEFAANGDPYFDLGNLWQEADLPVPHLEHLVTAYAVSPSRQLVARARLHGLTARCVWALWASIQDAVAGAGHDVWSQAMDRYERAAAELDRPHLERLLAEVAGPDRS